MYVYIYIYIYMYIIVYYTQLLSVLLIITVPIILIGGRSRGADVARPARKSRSFEGN